MKRERAAATVSRAKGLAAEIRWLLGISLCAILLFPEGSAPAEVSQGAQIAATCASCHDPTGGGLAIPPIAALDERAIVKAMLAFRASESPSHVMHAVALSLSDDELAATARYLADRAKAGRQP
ncbi:c-type cytochrome [Sinorhizobium meliloti]|uniref:c-type cytochrome n=1 Tax=Rhizobium meliloti TaxID=382 RepID=UPI0004F878B4|nr:c-type cytochrome [Sinorhizobium meliloti]AIM01700.1 cytochrome C553 [Sinorhizobium meliloti]ASQ01367.1 cytochrome C [Sinorhizobium meliloti]MDW9567291.1 cytochrome C [Sinorhizobium meliloti]MDW9704216.1 cytochrome C [Sinorhizobium meliloti]MDW9817806.1 cytochrome C [Sinorhizobium meliloti]